MDYRVTADSMEYFMRSILATRSSPQFLLLALLSREKYDLNFIFCPSRFIVNLSPFSYFIIEPENFTA
jgi:hypothetical protein